MSEDLVQQVLEAARWAPFPPRTTTLAIRRAPKRRDQRASGTRDGRGVAGESGDGRAEYRIVEKRLQGSRRRLLEAPVLVLICLYLEDLDAYPDAERQRGETTMAVQSLGAAAQNALLAAYDSGLDAGWMCAPSSAPRGWSRRWVSIRASFTRCSLGYADGDPEAPLRKASRRTRRLQGLTRRRKA